MFGGTVIRRHKDINRDIDIFLLDENPSPNVVRALK
jgi:hypothetical protein